MKHITNAENYIDMKSVNQEKRMPSFLYGWLVMLKWAVIAIVIGLIVGTVASVFGHALGFVNTLRAAHKWMVLLLPLGGAVIVFLYRFFKDTEDRGTNTVVSSVQEGKDIPVQMAPLIFVSTLITHAFGGSAGREGAALQLGGSIANDIGRLFRLGKEDQRTIIMTGMSAGFSALFGTPMAAAMFSMEVISVGVMHYAAIVPCVIASLTAQLVAKFLQVPPEVFPVMNLPELTPLGLGKTLLLALIVGGVSSLFCILLHKTEHAYAKYISNPYFRIMAAGAIVAVLASLMHTDLYLGSGMGIIEHIFHEGTAPWYAFILKMLFTALTLGAGFKGGEIVPSFTIGAALGCALAGILGLPVELAAACGMVGLFCGVTNSPITSLLIAFELFGFEGMPYYLVTVAVSYMTSGYHSLYHKQQIVVSKTRNDYAVHWDAGKDHGRDK